MSINACNTLNDRWFNNYFLDENKVFLLQKHFVFTAKTICLSYRNML